MRKQIDNPATGQHITFTDTASQAEDELLRMEIVIDPGGYSVEHIHPLQEERFEIQAGTLSIRLDGAERTAGLGAVVVVPSGTAHVWRNQTAEPVRMLAELRPALRTRELQEILCSWASSCETADGMPTNPLRLALFAREFRREVRSVPRTGAPISRLPRPVQDALLVLLAGLGRLAGLDVRSHRGW
jgi:quercetin dioxygenase-like cupin family protein